VFPAIRGEDKQKFNFTSVARYSALGGLVFSPAMFYWYRWLDKILPGQAKATLIKKVALDLSVLAVPLYSLFYGVINILEGQSLQFTIQELRVKLVPTIILAVLFWGPAQLYNFRYLTTNLRVPYVAACTFVEVNMLCFLKKLEFNNME